MSVYYVLKKVAITHLRGFPTLGNYLLLYVAMSLFVWCKLCIYIILLGQKEIIICLHKEKKGQVNQNKILDRWDGSIHRRTRWDSLFKGGEGHDKTLSKDILKNRVHVTYINFSK